MANIARNTRAIRRVFVRCLCAHFMTTPGCSQLPEESTDYADYTDFKKQKADGRRLSTDFTDFTGYTDYTDEKPGALIFGL